VFELPHGACNAIVLPNALEFMLPGAIGKCIQIAQALGEPVEGLAPRAAAERAIAAIRQLMQDIGMPGGLAAYNVTPDPFPAIAEKAAASFMIALSPRRATAADIVAILTRSL
jgi:alcohol dehydrogenase